MHRTSWATVLALVAAVALVLNPASTKDSAADTIDNPAAADPYLEVAAQFAPVLYQGVGPTPRGDYITNFDFDGDWYGDNNWAHCENSKYPLKGYVYYSVLETQTHYFIHYAMFHARDYKGGHAASQLLEMAKGTLGKYARKYDPTGLASNLALSHENDMEGCLVVAEKRGPNRRSATLTAIETLAHDRFYKYSPDPKLAARVAEEMSRVKVENATHPWLYIEAKGHGIRIYMEATEQTEKNVGHLIYRYLGRAEDPEKVNGQRVGYALIPIVNTLWPRAAMTENNHTYAEFTDYGVLAISAWDAKEKKEKLIAKHFGKLGSAFIGRVEGADKARPPWGWYDIADKTLRIGDWFFDPARAVKNHFHLDDTFSTTYVSHPYFDVIGK